MEAYFEKNVKRKELIQFMFYESSLTNVVCSIAPNKVTIRVQSDVSFLSKLRLNLTSVENLHVFP